MILTATSHNSQSGFEARQVEDLKFPQQSEAFERVRAVSEANEAIYSSFISPWVQAATNPWVAESLKWLHPMRTNRYLISDAFNPWMRGIANLAGSRRQETRRSLPKDHPYLEKEGQLFGKVSETIEQAREWRDVGYEKAFRALYLREAIDDTLVSVMVRRWAMVADGAILVVNSGSSSVKFALFETGIRRSSAGLAGRSRAHRFRYRSFRRNGYGRGSSRR